MKLRLQLTSSALLIGCLLTAATSVVAQPDQPRGPREPLGALKHAMTEAGAPDLTSDQEAQLRVLISGFRREQPSEGDRQAHTAYNAAILAGDLAAAQAQAAIIAQLSSSRLQPLAKFEIDVLSVLTSGGQLDALKAKFGDRLVQLVGSLAGGPRQGSRGPGGRPGEGPGGPRPRTPRDN